MLYVVNVEACIHQENYGIFFYEPAAKQKIELFEAKWTFESLTDVFSQIAAHINRREFVGAPVAEVEGRIGQHEVGLERRVAVVEEGVGVVLPQVGLDAPDGEVHLRHLPRRGVRILAVDRDVVDVAGVALDEARRLHEHPARTAAGVVDTPPEGLQHLHEGFDHARRGVEFAGQLALGLGEA